VIVKFINPRSNEGLAMQVQTPKKAGKIYLVNAFSLSMLIPMLVRERSLNVRFELINVETAKFFLSMGFVSAVGHPATAAALTKILSINVPTNRTSIQLQPENLLIVFQLDVGRLPVGKELTEEEVISAYNEGKAYFILIYTPETVEPPLE
jgi:hypothetical protein